MIAGFEPGTLESSDAISRILNQYANSIAPWAEAVASRMIAEVNARDHRQWMAASRRIGVALRTEIAEGSTGAVMRKALAEQVSLITSIPRDAAERVHRLTLEGISNSSRASELAAEIMRSGDVSRSRATLIARTETSRTATELVKARAQSVGVTHFIWRTTGDSDVRPSHRALNRKVFAINDPPLCDPPDHHALPGAIWNCRCWMEPIISDD